MKIYAVAIAGICLTGLVACSSATSTSAASQPAVASRPPATTPAAAVSSASSPPSAVASAAQATAQASVAPPTPGTATIAALWCGPVQGVIHVPSLSAWETGPSGEDDAYVTDIPNFKTSVAGIENPNTSAASEAAGGGTLCGEVQSAEEEPPPVDESMYATAMADFLQASEVLHALAGYPAGGRARPFLDSGLTELNAFLKAIGK
jgi:hypothetical protein